MAEIVKGEKQAPLEMPVFPLETWSPEVDKYIPPIYRQHMKETFQGVTGFDWDAGNRDKNRIKHNVLTGESEQVFFNQPLVILNDEKHSESETRHAAFGTTDAGRRLVVVFTLREKKIRVIAARDMKAFYEKQG